jgi:hypothetical protein
MEAAYRAAAALLAAGDPLGALSHVSRSNAPEALALCGCAFAQIGDMERAKRMLTQAARSFGARAPLERARCVTAVAEVSLASRELSVSWSSLWQAAATLSAHGDAVNALHARLVLARSMLLAGRAADAERVLGDVSLRRAPAQLVATAELIRAELCLRGVQVTAARAALQRAYKAAARAGIPALLRELARMQAALDAPAARLVERGHTQTLPLADVERVLDAATWLIDACRRELRIGARHVSFERKPVLLELLVCLGEAWPDTVSREQLIERGFGARRSNASHRARLRVELGRLRRLLSGLGTVHADGPGYKLVAADSGKQAVRVLLPPVDGEHAALLALLGDGERWSSSTLALALGTSQRTLQRALLHLEANGRVLGRGRGRARRWSVAPLWGLAPQLVGLLAL